MLAAVTSGPSSSDSFKAEELWILIPWSQRGFAKFAYRDVLILRRLLGKFCHEHFQSKFKNLAMIHKQEAILYFLYW